MSRELINSGVEWIGMIPSGWKIESIKNILNYRNVKNNDFTKTILSLSAKNGVTLYTGEGHSGNKPREDLSNYKIVYENDIVVNSMNILSGSVGLSKYDGCVSPVYYVYYGTNDCNINYYYYLLSCKEFQHNLKGLGNGILIKESETGCLNTIRTRIPEKKLGYQLFPVPTLEEQIIISNFLDKKIVQIDKLIKNQEEEIAKIKDYKKSVINNVVSKGISPVNSYVKTGIKWLEEIPSHWNLKKLKYIVNHFSKGNGITKEDIVVNGDTPCVRYGEIYTKYNIHFENCVTHTNSQLISNKQFFNYGDILFSGTGELVEEIGKNIVYLGSKQCLAGGDIIIASHNENPLFLSYALNSDYSQKQKSFGKAKLKVVHISTFNLGNIYIALPPKNEQKEIADYLLNISLKIDNLVKIKEKKIQKLQEYKKSLIYEYVTGKKEVK